MNELEPKVRFSRMWGIWRRWYCFVDNFFWYFWRPFWGVILLTPMLLEGPGLRFLLNFLRKKRAPTAKLWYCEPFYGVFMFLMFQCPNCRSSHLDELWARRVKRHQSMIPVNG